MLSELLMSARLARAWGLRDAVPTLLDLQRRAPDVRFRRHGAVLRMVRDGQFSYTVTSLMRSDNLQRLADVVEREDEVVLDAGANSGLFSRLVKQRHPGARVIAIEANPKLVTTIRRNLAPFDNWDVVQKALTDAPGTATFFRNDDAPQTSALDRENAEIIGRWSSEGISVACTSIDALAEEFALDRIDMLKMDIQGAETSAIAGAAGMLPRIRKLLIEVSFLDPRPEMLLARLRDEFGDPIVVELVHGGADLLYTRP